MENERYMRERLWMICTKFDEIRSGFDGDMPSNYEQYETYVDKVNQSFDYIDTLRWKLRGTIGEKHRIREKLARIIEFINLKFTDIIDVLDLITLDFVV